MWIDATLYGLATLIALWIAILSKLANDTLHSLEYGFLGVAFGASATAVFEGKSLGNGAAFFVFMAMLAALLVRLVDKYHNNRMTSVDG